MEHSRKSLDFRVVYNIQILQFSPTTNKFDKSNNPMADPASLWELKSNFEALQDVAEKQENRVQYHESKAQTITMAYLIWQRLLYFAVSRSSSSCSDWWMVLGLSLLCSLVYFLFFFEAVAMLFRVHWEMDVICEERNQICRQILVATTELDDVGLGDSGDGFHFQFCFHMKLVEYGGFRMVVGRKLFICFLVSALLALTALELYASNRSLCHSY